MKAEIITIGDEILIGQTVDTNSAFLGQHLSLAGIELTKIVSIADKREAIIEALKNAEENAQIILITGGLGPTKDDVTKKVLCEYFDTTLEIVPEIAHQIESYFKQRGREMLESNYLQAALPKSCIPLNNPIGTASGMWFEKDDKVYVSMPGVPYEMKRLMTEEVLPRLKKKFILPNLYHRTVMTEGIGESFLAEIIKEWEDGLYDQNIKLAYLPSPGMVKLRLSAQNEDMAILKSKVDKNIEALNQLVPQYIFGYDNIPIEKAIGQLLGEQNESISTAESCTGGYIAHLLTSISGSSAYFNGSVVSYANEAKINLLQVSESSIVKEGAVSQSVVEQMAINCRDQFNTTYALATSGVAGPDGGSDAKPVGTVWIALAWENGVFSKKFLFEKNRTRNIRRASVAALSMLKRKLKNQLN